MDFFTFSWGRNYIAVRGLLRVLGHTLSDPCEMSDAVIRQGVDISSSFMCFSGKAVIGQLVRQLDIGRRNLVYMSSQGMEACRCSGTGDYFERLSREKYPGFRAVRLGGGTREESLTLMRRAFPEATGKLHDRAFTVYYWKLGVLNTIAGEALKFRCRAADPQEVTRLEEEYVRKTDECQNLFLLWLTGFHFCRRLQRLPRRKGNPVLKIGLVGGEHILSELDSVMGRIKALANQGIHLEWRSGFFSINLMANKEKPAKGRDGIPYLCSRSEEYLRPEETGTEVLSTARALEFADEGFDGLLHIYAFGCMPQTAVKPAIQKIAADRGIPLLSLSLGDRFDQVSMETRIEAFIDVLKSRKTQGGKSYGRVG